MKSFWGYLIVMSKGISNFQIKNVIKNIVGEDLDDNFGGVFPSNYMNKFINHAAMISEKIANIHSLLLTLTVVERVVHTGGVY